MRNSPFARIFESNNFDWLDGTEASDTFLFGTRAGSEDDASHARGGRAPAPLISTGGSLSSTLLSVDGSAPEGDTLQWSDDGGPTLESLADGTAAEGDTTLTTFVSTDSLSLEPVSYRTASVRGASGTADGEPTSGSRTLSSTTRDGTTTTAAPSIETSSVANVFEKRVIAGADDVEERSNGGVAIASSDLEMAVDGTKVQTVGLRFTGIDIPKGAVITNAYIQFTVDEVSLGQAALSIRGENTDDAAPFTTAPFTASSRLTTNASVGWAPADWTVRNVADLAQRTPDLSAIIQEIVNRTGWANLNDIVFLINGSGTRTAESFEGKAAAAPLLHIEWQSSGPVGNPVAFNTQPDANPAANQIGELAAAGVGVGITASASDPDAGDSVTYSINDNRFTIGTTSGVITRSGTGTLDHETEGTVIVTVTARSSDTSTATRNFTINILDNPEPVAFNTPADKDPADNKIAQNAAAGTKVGITANATDPDAGDTVQFTLNDNRFAIDASGVITRSGTGTLNAGNEPSINLVVTATSSDGTVVPHTYTLAVTNAQLPTSVSLVNSVLTSQWSPPSPDPSGIAYISHLGTLLVSDGEVNEMSNLFTGANLFQMSRGGALLGTLTTLPFSDEPTGVAYNPTNHHLFFSDDTGIRSVYELNPGTDGRYGTSDDIVTSFRTAAFGSSDPEGITYDTNRGVLYLANGVDETIYTINPGKNGIFDGVASVGGDDVVTSMNVASLGINDPEAVEYDPELDLLYIIASRTSIAMVSTTGTLLGMLDISAASGAKSPAGLALAPSSVDPNERSLYVAYRGVDNNADPNENDGKIFEFQLHDDSPLV